MYIKVKTGGARTLDKVYAESLKFYKYIRYGLSYLEILDSNSETEIVISDALLVRKGLMRVFEFKVDYILQDIHTINDNAKIISQKDYNIRKYVLNEAFDSLDLNGAVEAQLDNLTLAEQAAFKPRFEVELCNYMQTDGINAQVSWCDHLRAWVLGSYSVCIIARSRDDLKLYPGYGKTIADMDKNEIRYNYVHLIANVWFDILDNLAAKPDFDTQKSEFLAWLSDKTLVGELVGVVKQIMHYPYTGLVFSSAICNDDAHSTCMLPEACFQF